MIYLAGSASLAILEIAVHTDVDGLLLPFVVIDVGIPDRAIGRFDTSQIPADELIGIDPGPMRALGDAWLASGQSLAVRVPSAVVPREFNYLVNPLHPAIGTLRIGTPQSIRLDPRIKT